MTRVVDSTAEPAAALLSAALDKRWKTLRKRLRKGLPRRQKGIDEAVRRLRTSSRRLLSLLTMVQRIGARKASRRMARRVHDILDRLGRLRDLTVQRELSSRLEVPANRRALDRFGRALDRDFRRSARKVRRQLRREGVSELKRDERRIRRRLGRRHASDRDAGGEVLKAVRSAFSELTARRRAVDPTRLDTLHGMRVSLKGFRYLMEALKPVIPDVSPDALEALHVLQTNMGDLHDLEVLSSALAEFAKDEPSQAAELASVLAELEAKHSRMLQSFLKSADVILDYWQRTLAAAGTTERRRGAARKRPAR